jgi:hypothetical protein
MPIAYNTATPLNLLRCRDSIRSHSSVRLGSFGQVSRDWDILASVENGICRGCHLLISPLVSIESAYMFIDTERNTAET